MAQRKKYIIMRLCRKLSMPRRKRRYAQKIFRGDSARFSESERTSEWVNVCVCMCAYVRLNFVRERKRQSSNYYESN